MKKPTKEVFDSARLLALHAVTKCDYVVQALSNHKDPCHPSFGNELRSIKIRLDLACEALDGALSLLSPYSLDPPYDDDLTRARQLLRSASEFAQGGSVSDLIVPSYFFTLEDTSGYLEADVFSPTFGPPFIMAKRWLSTNGETLREIKTVYSSSALRLEFKKFFDDDPDRDPDRTVNLLPGLLRFEELTQVHSSICFVCTYFVTNALSSLQSFLSAMRKTQGRTRSVKKASKRSASKTKRGDR